MVPYMINDETWNWLKEWLGSARYEEAIRFLESQVVEVVELPRERELMGQ